MNWPKYLKKIGIIIILFFWLLTRHNLPRAINKTIISDNKTIEITPKKEFETIKLPIILYHYVEYVKDPGDYIRKGLDVAPGVFEGQLKAFKDNHYKTFFVKEIPDIFNGNIDYSTKSAVLTFDDGYSDFYTDVFPLLKKYQTKATVYIVYDFIGRNNYMNKDQIKEIASSGLVEIGSHTLDHINLSSLSATLEQKQIFDSKKKLEEMFKVKVETFAYPYGAFNQKAIEMVKEAGYLAAVAVTPGIYQTKNNLYHLLRIRPGMFAGKNIVTVLEELKEKVP